jgi:predicted permease
MRSVELVNPEYFETLGVRARVGRLFVRDETNRPSSVAVISERFWQSSFDAAPSAIGEVVYVSGVPFAIIGVADDFEGWGLTRAARVDLWVPSTAPTVGITGPRTIATLVARIGAGYAPDVLERQLRQMYDAFRGSLEPRRAQFVPTVYEGLSPFQSLTYQQRVARMVPFVMSATALLLLIGCANATSLLLAHVRGRTGELAIRQAIGASRTRLIATVGTEMALLAMTAAGGGVLLGYVLMRMMAGTRLFSWAPELPIVPLNANAALVAVALSALTVMLCGVGPAVVASRTDVRALLAEGLRHPRRRRWHTVLVSFQLAAVIVLLSGGGILLRSIAFVRATDLGVRTDDIAAVRLDPARAGFRDDTGTIAIAQVVRTLRYAGHAAAYVSPPLFDTAYVTTVRSGDREVDAAEFSVSSDALDVLDIPLLAGRIFTETEWTALTSNVAILSASLVRELFGAVPAAAAVGRRMELGSRRTLRQVEIVGVAGDVRSREVLNEPRPTLYTPYQSRVAFGALYVRSADDRLDPVMVARSALREVVPQLPPTQAESLRAAVDRIMAEDIALASLLTLLAAVGATLTLGGVYATTFYAAAERMHEFGIRAALGASRSTLLRLSLRQTAVSCAIGIPLGLASYLAASRLLVSRVHGLSPTDAVTLGGVVAALAVAAVFAALPPAMRASHLDPAATLREI